MKNIEDKIDSIKREVIEEINHSVPNFDNEKRKLLDMCPDYLLDLSEEYDLIISGGMITSLFCNRPVNDIDVYLKNDKDVFPMVTELLENSTLMVVTDKSMLVNHSGTHINIVLFKTFKDAYDIFDSFDFTVCMGAFDLKEDKFYFHKDFFKHNSQRVLYFNSKTDYPIVSALRVSKYVEKGYSISKGEYVRIILACANINITSYEELESHIGGMYGLSLDKIIDTTIEFSLQNAIDQLQNPKKALDEAVDFVYDDNSGDDKIIKLLSRFSGASDLKKISKHDLVVYPSGRLSKLNKFMDVNSMDEHTGDVLLYKYVKKTDKPTQFESFYRSEFKYLIGEYVEDEKHGIHCGIFDSKSSFTYSNNENKVLIELKVSVDDINKMDGYSGSTVRRAFVVRAMKDTYMNNEDDINNPFS